MYTTAEDVGDPRAAMFREAARCGYGPWATRDDETLDAARASAHTRGAPSGGDNGDSYADSDIGVVVFSRWQGAEKGGVFANVVQTCASSVRSRGGGGGRDRISSLLLSHPGPSSPNSFAIPIPVSV